jgi:cysteine-S-conjugate beta-lyase
MIDHMTLFGLGYSWGGYESLILPVHQDIIRVAREKRHKGPLLRLSIGLENIDDLRDDLAAGFERMHQTA